MSSAEILIKSVLGALKLRPIHFVAGTLITAFALFSPEYLLNAVSISELVQSHRKWVGLLFTICSSLVATYLSIYIYKICRRNYLEHKTDVAMLGKLNNFTEDEKQILRFYIAKQTKTNSLATVMASLEAWNLTALYFVLHQWEAFCMDFLTISTKWHGTT